MTSPSSWFHYRPERKLDLIGSKIKADAVSVIIPVRDNQSGLKNLISSLETLSQPPREVIVVDNLSKEPVQIPPTSLNCLIVQCSRPGPASARNTGAGIATGEWLWFLDSDCLVEANTLENLKQSPHDAIGVCGNIKSLNKKLLNRYYESQEILMPQFGENNEPLYLVTASAAIHRISFLQVGGFDESFPYAAGEDIDLGIRLYERGRLHYASSSYVRHQFEEDLHAFKNRFIRYGAGNKILASKYGISLMPTPFLPNKNTVISQTLAKIQYQSLIEGYTKSTM